MRSMCRRSPKAHVWKGCAPIAAHRRLEGTDGTEGTETPQKPEGPEGQRLEASCCGGGVERPHGRQNPGLQGLPQGAARQPVRRLRATPVQRRADDRQRAGRPYASAAEHRGRGDACRVRRHAPGAGTLRASGGSRRGSPGGGPGGGLWGGTQRQRQRRSTDGLGGGPGRGGGGAAGGPVGASAAAARRGAVHAVRQVEAAARGGGARCRHR
mmetsp:Transcript_59851/g.143815  ORF Transcript_59851/g.143815 Transcript_59851/m.143815 type:complete len:212 (+) Transcript_59851:329-964(+)